MLSLEECKRILGPAAQGMSDQEILEIRDALRELVELAYEMQIAKESSTTQPPSITHDSAQSA